MVLTTKRNLKGTMNPARTPRKEPESTKIGRWGSFPTVASLHSIKAIHSPRLREGRSTQTLDWAEKGSPLKGSTACLSPEPAQRTPAMGSSRKMTHSTESPVPVFLPPCFCLLWDSSWENVAGRARGWGLEDLLCSWNPRHKKNHHCRV